MPAWMQVVPSPLPFYRFECASSNQGGDENTSSRRGGIMRERRPPRVTRARRLP
jgi:hypothetical protein